MKYTIYILFLLSFISSCDLNPPDPNTLYEKYRSSVVLIKNNYYFAIHFDNNLDFYYTIGSDGSPIMQDNQEEAEKNATTAFGTGFFISDDGKIATNRHVIYPEKSNEQIGEAINKFFYSLRTDLQIAINEKSVESSKIEDYYARYSSYLNYNDVSTLKDAYLEKKNAIVELEGILSKLNYNPNNTSIEMISTSLGIAFDNTHVTNSNDFVECVPIKKSKNEDIDLAIIQLKNKKTPVSVKEIISLKNIKKGHKLKLGDEVHMIGFNYGIKLAETTDGIKSQFTSGKITQDPDSKSVLYSIPSLHGSSGSPVINKWGELVAINFAKLSDEQNFNFGIPYTFLIDLNNNTQLEPIKEKVKFTSKPSESQATYKTNDENVQDLSSTDYSIYVRNLINAEDNRNFDDIYSHFSSNFKRYWDMDYPSYAGLKKRYEYVWSITSNGRNNIKRIDKIDNNTYDLLTNYEFYSKKEHQTKSIDSRVRFIFDSQGKITEIFGL